MDYQSNSDKSKEKAIVPEKKIEKVVTGEVVQRPKSIGYKFKNIFFGGDVKSAARYVAGDVLLPALRNLLFDTVTEGFRRTIFGESSIRRRPSEPGPRVSYHNVPINPSYQNATVISPRERARLPDQHPFDKPDVMRMISVLTSRAEAEAVVEQMIDIIDKYDVVSLADLREIINQPSTPIDNKWGWTYLPAIEVRQIREGYLIELPAMEAL